MPTFEHGKTTLYYEERGDGPPLLVIPGGGLNATIQKLDGPGSFNPLDEFSDSYRCVASDLRNANGGRSSGPLEADRPWDAFTDDHLALMDHVGAEKFMVVGFCIGGPMIWNLLKRAGDRVAAAVLAHPSGFRPEAPDLFFQNNINGWAPEFLGGRDDVDKPAVEAFLAKMYRENPDFVFTVTRDFVAKCETPVLIMPDDVAAHPFAAAMETARLAPNAQVSLYPWREPAGHVELALRHVRTFLKANAPALS